MIPVSAAFTTAAKASTRRSRARVTITWSDSYIDSTIITSATSENRVSWRAQIYNTIETVPYKWFHLDGLTTLGTGMRLAPSSATGSEMGWWSATRCNGSGVFSTPPELTMTFAARAVLFLMVVGDSAWGEYPVDFTIGVYLSGLLLYTETVVGNSSVTWEKDISSQNITEASRVVLTITKWSTANRVAKISEFYTSVKSVLDGDDIISLHVLEEMNFTQGSLPIGNISSNELDLEIQNIDNEYFFGNSNSIYHALLKPDRKIKVELDFVLADGTTEYVPMGTFFSGDWIAQELGASVTVSARDRLEKLSKYMFSSSELYTNKTLYQLAEIVLNDAKTYMPDLSWNIDAGLSGFTVPYAWFPKKTYRETIRDIVEACMGHAYMDRNDVLQIALPWNIAEMATLYEITSDNYFNKDLPTKIDEISNVISVKTQPRTPTPYIETDIYTSGETDIGVEVKTITVEFEKYMVATPRAFITGNKSTTSITSQVYSSDGTGATIQITASADDKFFLTIRGTPTREIIYESKEDITLGIESKTFTCIYEKPPVINGVAMIIEGAVTTTITTESYFAWKADVTVNSTVADTFKIRIYGVPVIIQGEESIEDSDANSVLEYGEMKYDFPNNHLIQTREIAETIVSRLLSSYKDVRRDIDLDWRGDPSLELVDTPLLPVYVKGAINYRAYYYIVKNDIDFDGTLRAKMYGRKLRDYYIAYQDTDGATTKWMDTDGSETLLQDAGG